jgi:amidohydrolase
MKILQGIDAEELVEWRRDLHAHPELAFAEHRTAAFIADKLHSFGIPVTSSIGGTGVVGVLQRGKSERCIMLRADMDALPIQEAGSAGHRSIHEGVMHACGHDGHVTMLLGAARHLARYGQFDGTVYLTFQPAEEGGGGAAAMIADGLFERFPATEVYGLHNLPGLSAGMFATRTGSLMAAYDVFECILKGPGGHAAFPEASPDIVGATIELIGKMRAAGTRVISPFEPYVLSVTSIEAPSAPNVIPSQVKVSGSFRTFANDARSALGAALQQLAQLVGGSEDLRASLHIQSLYPVLINAPEPTRLATEVIRQNFGNDCFASDIGRQLASEDFAFMLNERPGCFMLLGNGPAQGGCALHSPNYDFNDAILTQGSSYWVELAEKLLPHEGPR